MGAIDGCQARYYGFVVDDSHRCQEELSELCFDGFSPSLPGSSCMSARSRKVKNVSPGTASGLNHTACTFAVYASQRRLPERHARLASGRWPPLHGRDSTRRICSEGFRNDDSSHVISSPFSELCSAHARPNDLTLLIVTSRPGHKETGPIRKIARSLGLAPFPFDAVSGT